MHPNLATIPALKGHQAAMPEPYSLREVADELGIHPQTVKHHIYKTGHFKGKGKLIGRSLTFTQAELDEMKEIKKRIPPPGKPRKEKPPAKKKSSK